MNPENNSPLDSNQGGRSKWLAHKEYTDPAEKKRDLWLGVGLFFVLNIVLAACQFGLLFVLSNLEGNFRYSPLLTVLSWVLMLLPWVINIALIVYFARTRSQIALGMVLGFGIVLALAVLLGVVFLLWCFVVLFSYSGG